MMIARFVVRLDKRVLISTPFYSVYTMFVDQLDYAQNSRLIYEVKK